MSQGEANNWREDAQARNLVAALAALPVDTPLLVWCGLGHHSKIASPTWTPLGYRFGQLSGLDHFAIDQVWTVVSPQRQEALDLYAAELATRGGTAGFLREEAPLPFMARRWADAFVLSLDNRME